jgi:hypothetical protein
VVVVASSVAQVAVTPASVGDPRGYWTTPNGKAKVAIINCGSTLCGNIVALTEPNDPDTGQLKTDKNNPDSAKRTRPMIGVRILIAMKPGERRHVAGTGLQRRRWQDLLGVDHAGERDHAHAPGLRAWRTDL